MFRLEEVVLNIKSLNVLNFGQVVTKMRQIFILVQPTNYDAVELLEQIGALDKNEN